MKRSHNGYGLPGRLVYLVVEYNYVDSEGRNIGIFTNQQLARECADADPNREIVPYRLNQEGVAK